MNEPSSFTPSIPQALYVWLVPSEQVLEQPGSWRIRKWDTAPFPEANYTLSASSEKREPLTAQEWYEQFGPGKQAAPSATNAPDCPGCRMGLDLVEGLAHADANGYIVMGCERKR